MCFNNKGFPYRYVVIAIPIFWYHRAQGFLPLCRGVMIYVLGIKLHVLRMHGQLPCFGSCFSVNVVKFEFD